MTHYIKTYLNKTKWDFFSGEKYCG